MADEEETSSSHSQKRKLRERTKKFYTDDWALGDEIDEGRGFMVEDKIDSEKYDLNNFKGLYREMQGPELTVSHLQKHGLHIPLLFREKTGLGLQVPSKNFSVSDVRTCVGSKRVLDVMDVNTQKNEEMTMKEWVKYYEDPNKERLLNVISLEFSHTKLENYVQSPKVVREIDWVDVVWPRHLKEQQVESTNSIEDMMYPKVQKYCLMSVKGCYTDFHVDFGGTSVWYHILKGKKIFWLIPPTEKNIMLYQNWVLSGKQSDVFFGDLVEKCGRIKLGDGMTMFIPTGWIHAVYTPEDSLVFGGNFLHSFGIDKQLRVAQVEEQTKVPQKFRYPFFTEMLWYVLERYVHVLLSRSHLEIAEGLNRHIVPRHTTHVHLTPYELHGLKTIVMYLHSLPSSKKNVPELIKDPVALIHDVRCLVEQHRHDSPELAVTGIPVLPPPPALSIAEREALGVVKRKAGRPPIDRSQERQAMMMDPRSTHDRGGSDSGGRAPPRRRRTRCKNCDACSRTDCGECVYCSDMIKFGGSGRAKQTCLRRQCMRPNLPITAACKICALDGWGQTPAPLLGRSVPTTPSTLMECSVCYDIVHPQCYNRDTKNYVINDDLPNSWECPECCESGRNLDGKGKALKQRGRKMSLPNSISSSNQADAEHAITPIKKYKADPDETWSVHEMIDTSHQNRYIPPNPMMNSQIGVLSKSMKTKPSRYTHYPPLQQSHISYEKPYVFNKWAITSVFKFLPKRDLANCACVCKSWCRLVNDPFLWKRIAVTNRTLTAAHLTGITSRQPETLILDWTMFAKVQLNWLLGRMTQLRHLSLRGCSWSGVSALNTYSCPVLISLNLSAVTGLNDASIRDIFYSPSDTQSGLVDKTSRLKCLRSLSLAHCDITDVALRYISQHLSFLQTLDLSSCRRITDAGIAQLASPPAATVTMLVSLNLANCVLLSDLSVDYLTKCQALKYLDLRHTYISPQRVMDFASNSNNNLYVTDGKLVLEMKEEYNNMQFMRGNHANKINERKSNIRITNKLVDGRSQSYYVL